MSPMQGIQCPMGFLPDTLNCGLRMRRECRERFPRHRVQWKLLVSNPGMHHGTCVTHVPWCMSRSLTRGGGENVAGIPDACATSNFTYLARATCRAYSKGACQWIYDPETPWYTLTRVFNKHLHQHLSNKTLSEFNTFINTLCANKCID